jgi:hypothetical protein
MTNQQRDTIREALKRGMEMVNLYYSCNCDSCAKEKSRFTRALAELDAPEAPQPNTGSPVLPPASPEGERGDGSAERFRAALEQITEGR